MDPRAGKSAAVGLRCCSFGLAAVEEEDTFGEGAPHFAGALGVAEMLVERDGKSEAVGTS